MPSLLKLLAKRVLLVFCVLVWLSFVVPQAIDFPSAPVFCGITLGLGVALPAAGFRITKRAWLVFLFSGLLGWLAEVVLLFPFTI
ncbi:MAG: hypothetical protein JWM48_2116 [Mycobacterium sp.]|jgi:hypothetical protein|nr:hypothetical protein [Mycobacterium sp.]